MNPAAETYKLAFMGKVVGGLKSVGKFTGALPLWLLGSAGVHKLFGKEPEVRRVVLPPSKIEAMRRPQQNFAEMLEEYRKQRFMAGPR